MSTFSALWLDSEAIVTQPFRIRQVFDDYVKNPVVFTSRIAPEGGFHDILAVLGRSEASFASKYWNIER